MRHLGKIIAALTFGFVHTPAFAADGIRASAVASRTAPADIVSVGFQIAEPAAEPGQEKEANILSALVKAFEARGINVLEASETQLPFFNNANVNTIGPASQRAKHTKQLLLKLSGFRRTEEIAEVLEGNGIRQNIGYTFDSTKYEAIRADLQREAIAKAVAQAQDWARDADVKTGKVIDLVVVPVSSISLLALMPNNQAPLRWNVDQSLIHAAKDGEPSLIRYTVAATVVLATRPE
jgi:uncharacterized protein YggE